jgi:hypothetical protein
MQKTFIIAILLLLTGCMSSEERMAANNAKDDQACLSYGAKPGTDAYVTCRAQLEGARRQADAAEDAAWDARRAAREEARREARRQN